MIFLGYDQQSKAYRCYDPVAKRVAISRNITFCDSIEFQELNLKGETAHNDFSHKFKRSDTNDITVQEEKDSSEENIDRNIENEVEANVVPEPSHDLESETNENIIVPENEGERNIIESRYPKRSTRGVPPDRYGGLELNFMQGEVTEPRTYEEAISCKEKYLWIEAMKDEMNSLKKNGTWELLDLPKDRKAVGCKWVFKLKRSSDGAVQRYKARLVAKGYSQKFGSDYNEVFAPVVRQVTFRTLLTVSSMKKLNVVHLDVKTAFLNGTLNEIIYMEQPPGFKEDTGKVCLLKKSLYGLKQAARAWNEAIHHVLIEAKFIQSKTDQCLYSKLIENKWCYLLIYVDDIMVAFDSHSQLKYIESTIKAKFDIEYLGNIKQYLGIEVSRNSDNDFEICQSNYIKRIVLNFGLQDAKSTNTPIEVGYYSTPDTSTKLLQNDQYRKLIGCLLFVSVNTRPDIAASVNILAQKVSSPSQNDWNQLKRVVKYLKSTMHLKLNLKKNDNNMNKIVGYADANWAEDRISRKSNSGYAFFFNGSLISWSCRKQTCVSLSSTEAEFVALSDACQEAVWLQRLLFDMHLAVVLPITIFEDNQGCLKLIKGEKFSNRTKHIDTKFHFVKDYVEKNLIQCEYCPTENMIADLFTKPLPLTKHQMIRNKLNLL